MVEFLQGVFGFGTVAHSVLLAFYLLSMFQLNKVHTIFYALGHLLLVIVMALRINLDYDGSLLATIIGSSGHGLLILFAFVYNSSVSPFFKQSILYQVMNTGFIAGQIGMIANYVRDYNFGSSNNPLDILSLVSFSILMIYYIFKTMSVYSEQKIGLAFGVALVSILYGLEIIYAATRFPLTGNHSKKKTT
jgi:hypothetical protein